MINDEHNERHVRDRDEFEKLMAELPQSRDFVAARLRDSGDNLVPFENPSKPQKTSGELIQDFVKKLQREAGHDTD